MPEIKKAKNLARRFHEKNVAVKTSVPDRLAGIKKMHGLIIKGQKKGLSPGDVAVAKGILHELRSNTYPDKLREHEKYFFIEGLRGAIVAPPANELKRNILFGLGTGSPSPAIDAAKKFELEMRGAGYTKEQRVQKFIEVLRDGKLGSVAKPEHKKYKEAVLEGIKEFTTAKTEKAITRPATKQGAMENCLRTFLMEKFKKNYAEEKDMKTLANKLVERGYSAGAVMARLPILYNQVKSKGNVRTFIAELDPMIVGVPSEAEIIAQMQKVEADAANYWKKKKTP